MNWIALAALLALACSTASAQITTTSQFFAYGGNWALNGPAEYSCHQHQILGPLQTQYQDWQRATYCLNTWTFHATSASGPHVIYDSCYNISFTVSVTAFNGNVPMAMTWIGITVTTSTIGITTVAGDTQRTYRYTAGCLQFHELVSLYQVTKQEAFTIKLSPATSVPLVPAMFYRTLVLHGKSNVTGNSIVPVTVQIDSYPYRSVPTNTNVNKLSSLINRWTRANGWKFYENIDSNANGYSSFCSPLWYGLTCNSAGDVTRISLGNNNLVGNLTLWMAQIGGASWTSLLKFSIGSNQLYGTLPATFGQTWTQLQTFQINNNLFTGSLPPTLGANWGSSMLTFSAAQNQFSGTIPVQFGTTWLNVQHIALNNNQLSGSLPTGQNWANLISLALSFNLLSGTMPVAFGNGWTSIQQLYLNSNTGITGFIPSTFGSSFTQVWYQNTSMSQYPVPNMPGYQVWPR